MMYRLFYFVLCLLFFCNLGAMRSFTRVQEVASKLNESIDCKSDLRLFDRIRKQSLAMGNSESLTDLLVAKAQTIIYANDYYVRMYYDMCLMNHLINLHENSKTTMDVKVDVDCSFQQCISHLKLTKKEKAVLLSVSHSPALSTASLSSR